jgi:hypothetical protein
MSKIQRSSRVHRRNNKMAMHWKDIDWNQRDADIARQYGVNRASVFELRGRLFERGLIKVSGKMAKKLPFANTGHIALTLQQEGLKNVRILCPSLKIGVSVNRSDVIPEVTSIVKQWSESL